jgi:hypothetical protein
MIVIGVDVHKQSLTAVAVDDAGRMLDEKTILVGSDELVGWAAGLAVERLWAVEDLPAADALVRAAVARARRGSGAGAAEADGAGAARRQGAREGRTRSMRSRSREQRFVSRSLVGRVPASRFSVI